MRAASVVCLHLLVILEQLPVKVQHYNIRNLYGWIKQGVKAYGMYQSARPYMPYVNSAYYLSRYAMGSNPFSLLAWWVASEVTTRGASAAAQHLFNQKALALLNDVVRVIGYEVASMYGGDVRHRDANWIYAAELTELASEYPLSREGLVHAMKEVGALQLVNEYDRIFLFRCLAGGKSAEPGRYKAKVCLHTNERQAVVTRLEKFFRGFARAGSDKRYARWSAGVQERLGIKLHDGGSQTSLSPPDQAKDALRSLASFLVDVKQREGEELAQLLTDSAVLSKIDDSGCDDLLRELAENPPFFFEQPELDPSAEIATVYLEDLARLAIVTPPRDVPFEPLLEEVAAYLRVTPSRIRKLMDQQYMQLFRTRCSENDSVSNATPAVARAFLRLGEMDERAQFTYHNIRLQWAEEANSDIDFGDDLWLVGTNQRLILLDAGEVPTILWVGEASDTLLEQSGQWAGTCIVSGGTWIAAPPDQPSPTIIVRARIHQRFQDYFGPLLRYCQSDQRSNIP